MKVGDKVYCIKTYISEGKYVHLKNKFYTVQDIDNILSDTQRIWIVSEPDSTPHGYLGYKEYRKLKLEKINEGR